MLTIILCIIGGVYGQYPYPPPAPAARPLSPPEVQYSPTLVPQITPLKIGPYPAAQVAIVKTGPYPPARISTAPYPAPQPFLQGGQLSPVEQDGQGPYQPSGVKQLSGGEVSPEELEIPRNTQIKIQDKQLQYTHGFSDDKGTEVREQGSLLSTNDGWEYVIAKRGSYSYVSPEGKSIKVNYIADHNGYRVLPS